MPTTVRLDDGRLLQLIRNTQLWSQFPVFKNLAIRAQSAMTKINASSTGCSSCAARKRMSGNNKLKETIKSVKDTIVRMSVDDRNKLKKALNADYIKFVVTDTSDKPRELMY